MVHLVVTAIVKEGMMDDYLRECRKVRPLVLAEKGCVEYTFIREIPSHLAIQEKINPDRVTLIEKWETMEDLAAYGQSSHMKEFGPRAGAMRHSITAVVAETAV